MNDNLLLLKLSELPHVKTVWVVGDDFHLHPVINGRRVDVIALKAIKKEIEPIVVSDATLSQEITKSPKKRKKNGT